MYAFMIFQYVIGKLRKTSDQSKYDGKYMGVKSDFPGKYMKIVLFILKKANVILHWNITYNSFQH